MVLINLVDVMTALHNLMGHRVAPGGTDDDLQRYCQEAFKYAWRYYKWTFSLQTANIVDDGNGNYFLPADFDLDGYREFAGLTEVPLKQTLTTTASNQVAIVWDKTENRYKLTPGTAAEVIYQVVPPVLGTDETGRAPFPSAMTVAIGAAIYAKQGNNPTRADISQEWDEFHAELDRHVGRADRNNPRPTVKNYLDRAGSYTGNVGG